MSEKVLIAIIGRAHGLKGEVRVNTFTADPLALGDYGPLQLSDGTTLTLATVKPSKNVAIATFKGVTSRTAAEKLNNKKLFVDRDSLPELEDEDEFYHTDLIGCTVQDANAMVLGKVLAVPNYGAGDLLDIEKPNGKSFLLPFTQEAVPHISLTDRLLTAIVPEGLMDEEKPPRKKHGPKSGKNKNGQQATKPDEAAPQANTDTPS